MKITSAPYTIVLPDADGEPECWLVETVANIFEVGGRLREVGYDSTDGYEWNITRFGFEAWSNGTWVGDIHKNVDVN